MLPLGQILTIFFIIKGDFRRGALPMSGPSTTAGGTRTKGQGNAAL